LKRAWEIGALLWALPLALAISALSLWAFPVRLALASCAPGWAMLAVALVDARHFIVPDVLSLPAIPAGLLASGSLLDPSADIPRRSRPAIETSPRAAVSAISSTSDNICQPTHAPAAAARSRSAPSSPPRSGWCGCSMPSAAAPERHRALVARLP